MRSRLARGRVVPPMLGVRALADHSWVRGDVGFPPPAKGIAMSTNEPGCSGAANTTGGTRRPRPAIVKSAVLATPALALLMTAGAASAATTQQTARAATHTVHRGVRPAAAANVTWHNLTLMNGWQAASGRGLPAYAISNGVVYMTGGLTQPSNGPEEFAVLPKAARPSHAMYRSVDGFAGAEVTLFILPDGSMQVY